jgi:predicted Zn-dependent protease
MKRFSNAIVPIFRHLFVFLCIFTTAQFSRELIFRPLITNTIGPIKTEKHLYIDDIFSEEENTLITSVVEEWVKKTGGVLTIRTHFFTTAAEYLTLQDSKSISITKMGVNENFIEDAEEGSGKLLGLHTKRFVHTIIVLNTDRIPDKLEFRATLLHELGHAFGLEHNYRKNTLMYPSDEFGALTITNEDIRQFCLIYFCNPKKLSNQ